MSNRILFVLLAGMFAGSLSADPVAVVKLEPYRNTIAMHAKAGGRDGFFVFDTGAGIPVLNPQFAEKICTPWGRNTGFAMMGNRMEHPRCDDVTFTIGGQKLKVPVVSVLDVMTLYPKDAAPIDGLISLKVFDGKAITIDFPAWTLTIETPSSLRRRIRDATEVPVSFVREMQGQALAVSVGVPTPRGRVWMELDTGNSRTILISKPYADLFGIDPSKKEAQPVDFPLAGKLRVAGNAFAPDMIIDGNIGMPFLKDAVVTFDFASGRVWIRHP